MSVFHTYDIRGQYPEEIDESFAKQLGNAFARHTEADHIVAGFDARDCSESLHDAFVDGVRDAGTDVTTVGMAETPLICWLVQDYDGGVAVTASHNPPGYGGFKLYDGDGDAIGMGSGLEHVKEAMQTYHTVERGDLEEDDVTERYAKHLIDNAPSHSGSIIVDLSNGSASPFAANILDQSSLSAHTINDEPDGTFPNHSPNPLKEESQATVKERVGEYDFGVVLDADGDRAIFIDDNGRTLKSSTVIALHAQYLYEDETVVLDALNYRKAVIEAIEEAGCQVKPSKVGFPHVRAALRLANGVAGAEYSGHFSHRVTNYADNSLLAVLKTAGCCHAAGESLSTLADSLEQRTVLQANLKVDNKDTAVEQVDEAFTGETAYIDGVTKVIDTSWFNVRKSNTEPLLRVTVETPSGEAADELIQRVMDVIGVDEVHGYS